MFSRLVYSNGLFLFHFFYKFTVEVCNFYVYLYRINNINTF